MKKRILLVTYGPPNAFQNKAGLFPKAIRNHLELGFDVSLYAAGDRLGRRADELSNLPGIDYVNRRLSEPLFGRFMSKDGRRNYVLRRLTEASRKMSVCAVVGIQSARKSGLLAKRIADELDVPFASWEHSSSYARSGELPLAEELRDFFSRAAFVAAVSPPVLTHIERKFSITLKNAFFIPNPIPEEFEELGRPERNKFQHLVEGRPAFGAWTNWRPVKRLDLLLRAFRTVRSTYPDAVLLIAGNIEPDHRKALSSEIDEGSVHFLGKLQREDIRHLSSAVSCCCISSDFETFGLPAIEALSLGRPVVSTRTDGPASVITEEFLGHLVPVGDPDAFASAMIDVVANAERFSPDRIREFTLGRFGRHQQIERWRTAYRSIGLL